MQTYQHFFQLPHHKAKGLAPFYIAAVLRTFVLSFLILFLPIIIMNKYLIYGEQNAIIIAIGYFIFTSFAQIFALVLACKVASVWGLKTNFLLAQIAMIAFLISTLFNEYSIGFFFLSIAAVFWWFSYHIYFTDFGKKDEFGHEVGLMEAVSVLSGALAPIIGGLVLVEMGNSAFYYFGALIIFISIFFILSFDEPKRLKPITYTNIIRVAKRNSDDMVAFIGAGAEEAISTIVWPVLLYLLFKDYLKIGTYFSIVMISVVIVNYFVGTLVDTRKKERLEKIGSVAVFFSWLTRAFIHNPLFLSIAEVIYKLFLSLFKLPLLVIAYDHAYPEKEDYIAFRELAYKIGAIAGYGSFVVILMVGLPIWTILIVSALFSLLPLKINQPDKNGLVQVVSE